MGVSRDDPRARAKDGCKRLAIHHPLAQLADFKQENALKNALTLSEDKANAFYFV
jgi:hypothetical protein